MKEISKVEFALQLAAAWDELSTDEELTEADKDEAAKERDSLINEAYELVRHAANVTPEELLEFIRR